MLKKTPLYSSFLMHTALSLTIRRDISVNIACMELIDKAHRRQLSARGDEGKQSTDEADFSAGKRNREICGLSFLPPPRLNFWYIAQLHLLTF